MKNAVVLMLLFFQFALWGCECVAGLGRDMQKAGDWIEKKAEESK